MRRPARSRTSSWRRRQEVVDDLPRVLDARNGRIEDVDWPLERNVRAILARRHGFDPDDRQAVTMWDTSLQTLMFDRMIGHMKTFFTIVGVVTLTLGGIGVMNIMLIAVKERTREIGIRKALGATTRVIQRQFFFEGFLLTLLSGGAGMVLALGLCAARQSGADAGPLRRDDPVVAGGRAVAGDARRHRRRHVDVSGAPSGGAAAGRSAAVRDVMRTAPAFADVVREALAGLYHHRFRAALSMLGISWGIISVVTLLAYGDGFRGALDAGFRGAFSDGTVVAFPGQTSLQAGGERAGKRVQVTPADVLDIGELPLVKNVSPEFMREFSIKHDNRQSSHLVRGVAASYGVMRSETPQPGGRFLDEEDVRLRRRVAFVGSEVQRKLFGSVPPVGQTIRVGGQPFEIVGVGEDKVQLSNYNRPDKYCVFIPWTTMSGLTDTKYVNAFVWQAVSPPSSRRRRGRSASSWPTRYRYDAGGRARDRRRSGPLSLARSPTASSAG